MQNKKTKIRGGNILFGILVVLEFSFGPTAFDIRFHRGVPSQRCSTIAFTTNTHASTITGNDNLLTRIRTCSHNQNKNWDNNSSSKTIEEQTIPTKSQNAFSWFAVALLLLVGRFAVLTNSNSSRLGVSTTVAALYSYAATIKRPTKPIPEPFSLPNLTQQAILLGGSFALFRILSFRASAISSWYMGLLAWSPLVTKTVTTATIGVLGDTTAQYIETRFRDAPREVEDHERTIESSETITIYSRSWLHSYDRRRGLSVFGENILVSGPLLHFAYNFMEYLLPTTLGGRSAIFASLGHAFLDNFVLDTIFLAIMFFTTGIAEGHIHEIIPQFRKDFVPTLKMGWFAGLCLLPIQFLLFRFFPLSLRVLGVNIIDIFWEAYVSYMVHRRRRNAEKAQ